MKQVFSVFLVQQLLTNCLKIIYCDSFYFRLPVAHIESLWRERVAFSGPEREKMRKTRRRETKAKRGSWKFAYESLSMCSSSLIPWRHRESLQLLNYATELRNLSHFSFRCLSLLTSAIFGKSKSRVSSQSVQLAKETKTREREMHIKQTMLSLL